MPVINSVGALLGDLHKLSPVGVDVQGSCNNLGVSRSSAAAVMSGKLSRHTSFTSRKRWLRSGIRGAIMSLIVLGRTALLISRRSMVFVHGICHVMPYICSMSYIFRL